MTAKPPPGTDPCDPGEPTGLGSDLEYDLAHEVAGATTAAEAPPSPHIQVATQTDYDGDYGYDLAHDVPKN